MKKVILILLILFSDYLLQAQNVSFNWVKQIGSADGVDGEFGCAIRVDNSGNVYTAGVFSGTTDFDPGPGVFNLTSFGTTDIFVSKVDVAGNFIWVKQMGGNSHDYARSIAIDASGNIYITGNFLNTADFDPGPGVLNLTAFGLGYDIFVSKLDAAGDFIWAKQMGADNGQYIGDLSYSIAIDASGNIYTTGEFSGTADFDPGLGVFNLVSSGYMDMFISKLDANGNFIWAKRMGGTFYAVGYSLAIDALGNIYTTGSFSDTVDFDPGAADFSLISDSLDIFILKINSSGDFIWAKQMGGGGRDLSWSITTDVSGNVYTTGSFSGIGDFDPGPAVFNLNSFGNCDIYVSKLDAAGNFIWAKQMGGSGEDAGRSITVDATGNVYTTGHFGSTADFDPGVCVYNLNTAGYNDIFVSKLDAIGNFAWAKHMGGPNNDGGLSVTTDGFGNVYTTGYFLEVADFNPGTSVFNLTSFYYSDVFIHKMSLCISSTNSTVTLSACGPYTINCQTFTSSGVYTIILENATGCDSIVTLNLIITSIITGPVVSATACSSYIWNGQIYTTSGIYSDTLVTANGCDSIITLHLTMTNAHVTSAVTASACNSYTLNGQVYTTSGVYRDTLIAASGCDSIITLTLTIITNSTSTFSAATCSSYIWNGQIYAGSGIYTDTLMAAGGCDSIVTLQLTIKPGTNSSITQSICEGQNYEGYTAYGIYIDTLIAANGCDSIRTLRLIVIQKPVPDLGADRNLCSGDSLLLSPGQFNYYLWQDGTTQNNIIVKQPGLYSVMVGNNCGIAKDVILIKEKICDIYFPSAFTPNNDGKNDLFKVLGANNLSDYHLLVYNRWGQKVFETYDFTKGWTGMINGKLQNTGVFVWYCEFKKQGVTNKMKGTVTLIK